MSTATHAKTLFDKCPLSISPRLQAVLIDHINTKATDSSTAITLNFRDTSYSAEAGGFHPVEIAMQKDSEQRWSILYITDFGYIGNAYPELERNVDFDIGNNMAFFTGVGWQAIDAYGVNDFYQIWESNFLSYLEMDAFDEIKLSSH
ncbi:TPA: DUF2787 domain-containing protein [Vibrio alginolyticus]|uniref:DUF2787 domain-containing protein n=1 Tax=Vibrio alginolyticus TaxID=663 RepID=UPI001BD6D898|nr:DUF2787 domain-containing protein [Vibrio alginolyticus]EGQ8448103.1 DUF2787 domain-containing protein [Vibrio alginolyticus]EJV5950201.1 DUF2787 domain-containing protein [Vibrio alginolyticus]ELB2853358.1 DUF2787 domain-containing protein [Vibrio alginolyticus]MBT0011862.1 DUF2787 domain-containing protein [Vibrio alginolyticus]MBT0039587.1 DUF2787 domain-containing protein [Vibrio alginolyticus]